MSGVPLSPEAPGVERVSRAPSSPRSPARRCLFGPVDHELLARDLERSLRAMENEKSERWNFDFRNHRPLPGPLHWEETEKAPEFYRRGQDSQSQWAEGQAEPRAKKRNGETAGESNCARQGGGHKAPVTHNYPLYLFTPPALLVCNHNNPPQLIAPPPGFPSIYSPCSPPR
eukprot:XP_012810916.1 PREDICTED: LOW QUALITY PROTEIN: cyclin-dependent kinase inhibitor 1B-like [Xenopus tropicalis]